MGELFDWLLKVENIKSRRFFSIFLVLAPLLFFFGGAWQGATFDGMSGGFRSVFLVIMIVMFVMGLLLITWPKGHHLYPPEEDSPPMEWQIEEAKSEAIRLELMRDEANRKLSETPQDE